MTHGPRLHAEPPPLRPAALRTESTGRSFGGLGMMIDQPRVELELAAASEWSGDRPGAQRARDVRPTARSPPSTSPTSRRRCASHVRSRSSRSTAASAAARSSPWPSPPASARSLGLPPGPAAELAAAVGRGARSAVGSHGFVHGGLIWERAARAASRCRTARRARRAARRRGASCSSPPPRGRGLSGVRERRRLRPAAAGARRGDAATRSRSPKEQILPAARAGDLDAFGEAVYEYGRLAGECFAAVQGGPYASPEIAELRRRDPRARRPRRRPVVVGADGVCDRRRRSRARTSSSRDAAPAAALGDHEHRRSPRPTIAARSSREAISAATRSLHARSDVDDDDAVPSRRRHSNP